LKIAGICHGKKKRQGITSTGYSKKSFTKPWEEKFEIGRIFRKICIPRLSRGMLGGSNAANK
jgi:hypothetical protein